MLLGPIFRAELLRTSRRGRYYGLRLAYGLLLLWVVWAGYEGEFLGRSSATIADVARFAEETFLSFTIAQVLTVLALIPPLFGGAVADEKQRRTLHYLMASRLSGAEIVLDKVLARSAMLGVFLAIGLPVVSLLGLFGGVSAEYVASAFVGTASSAAFAVSMTVLVSTLARRVRQAVLVAFVLELAWLFVPTWLGPIGRVLFPTVNDWIAPVIEVLKASSPFLFWVELRFRGWWAPVNPAVLWAQFVQMVGLQLAGSALMLLMAILLVRPTFRRQEATPERRTWFGAWGARRSRRWRWLARPACGDDAMLWKERHFATADIFTKLALYPAIVLVTIPLALLTEFDGQLSLLVVQLWNHSPAAQSLREELAWALRIDLGWYAAFWLLAVAGASASCITAEREADTWVSLTSTPMTGWEIVRGKVLGSIWNQRGFGAVLVMIWALGLATGAIHPLGVLASMGVLAVLTWFVAMLGVYASMAYRTTARALTAAIVALAIFNGSPFLLVLGYLGRIGWEDSFGVLGAMPWLSAGPLVTHWFVHLWWPAIRNGNVLSMASAGPARFGLLILSIYAGVAALLTFRVVGRFDRWLDRPRLTEGGRPPG